TKSHQLSLNVYIIRRGNAAPAFSPCFVLESVCRRFSAWIGLLCTAQRWSIRTMRKFFLLCLLGVLCFPAASVRADTPEEQLAAASALFDAQKYPEAALKLDAFLTATPKHAKAGAAAFTLGRCRVELKQYPQAIAAYEK